jgi:hypothetical protein
MELSSMELLQYLRLYFKEAGLIGWEKGVENAGKLQVLLTLLVTRESRLQWF